MVTAWPPAGRPAKRPWTLPNHTGNDALRLGCRASVPGQAVDALAGPVAVVSGGYTEDARLRQRWALQSSLGGAIQFQHMKYIVITGLSLYWTAYIIRILKFPRILGIPTSKSGDILLTVLIYTYYFRLNSLFPPNLFLL